MTTNLFVIGNVNQLRTGGSFRILLIFFRTSSGVGVLNTAIFKSFHNRVEFGTILEGLPNFGGGGVEPTNPPPPRYATDRKGTGVRGDWQFYDWSPSIAYAYYCVILFRRTPSLWIQFHAAYYCLLFCDLIN